jgi:hypothetical protein
MVFWGEIKIERDLLMYQVFLAFTFSFLIVLPIIGCPFMFQNNTNKTVFVGPMPPAGKPFTFSLKNKPAYLKKNQPIGPNEQRILGKFTKDPYTYVVYEQNPNTKAFVPLYIISETKQQCLPNSSVMYTSIETSEHFINQGNSQPWLTVKKIEPITTTIITATT